MATTLDPNIEARIADLAGRLGFAGPGAQEQVLKIALDDLDVKTPPARPMMTPEQIAHERKVLEQLRAAGRQWREQHPGQYDENNPPSIAWQEELYDEDGLPK